MPVYELINPSDSYTLVAPNLKEAVIVCLFLGNGMYGLLDDKGEEAMPILIDDAFATEWVERTFGCAMKALFDGADWEAVARCFDSVAIVPIKYRDLYDRALASMPEDERVAYAAKWHDEKRTSMNNIGERAAQWAEKCRERAKAEQP